ncbi:MAG: dephospho-CoA kinase [Candidatus Eremiobacteraeota bacterium]|nr:dephospho-CoA kinase [Candidatus Eremiobacteraeota bacterium]
MRVGLTGGIGAGKTAVARLFEEFGAYVIDTDLLAREAAAPNSDGFLAITRAWPDVVRHGVLDRAALAEIIFKDPAARERLNAILHPHVRRLAFEREARAGPGQLVVHVVPLLFETQYDELMDKSVLVTAPQAVRIERIVSRDHLDEARVRARMAAQIAPDRARGRADYVIENDSDVEDLRRRTRSVYNKLVFE